MFRKISSAAADAHSFSSLASPPNGKLSSLFTRPPKPSPLNSRNSTSRFTIPAETTSSLSTNSLHGQKIRLATARLQKFLKTNCEFGDVGADEVFCFFHRMVQMEPCFPLYSFNLLLRGLAEKERYYAVLSLYGKMNSVELIPNFVTLNILLKCLCYANRVSDGFLVMGRIIRMGYRPNSETFNSLFEGLLIVDRFPDAERLFERLAENLDCFPDETTSTILTRVIDKLEYTGDFVVVNKDMISENDIYDQYLERLCKEWMEDKAEELSPYFQQKESGTSSSGSDVDVPGHQPLSVNPMAEHVKGEEELKSNIHGKNTCLDWETLHDQLNRKVEEAFKDQLIRKEIEDFLGPQTFEGVCPP